VELPLAAENPPFLAAFAVLKTRALYVIISLKQN